MKEAYFMVLHNPDNTLDFFLTLDKDQAQKKYSSIRVPEQFHSVQIIIGHILEDAFIFFNPSAVRKDDFCNRVFVITLYPCNVGLRANIICLETPTMCEIVAGMARIFTIEPGLGQEPESSLKVYITTDTCDEAIKVAQSIRDTLMEQSQFFVHENSPITL